MVNAQLSAFRSFAAAVLVSAVFVCAPADGATISTAQLGFDNALLNQFNLVTLSTSKAGLTTSNETEGRIVVGGNVSVSGTTNVCFASGCAGNTSRAFDSTGNQFGALTVFGNITGGYNTGNNGGDIYVGGTSSGTYNLRSNGNFDIVGSAAGTTVQSARNINTTQSSFAGTIQNGGKLKTNQPLASVFPFAGGAASFANTFANPLTALSQAIAALPGTYGSSTLVPDQNNLYLANHVTVGGKSYGIITTSIASLAAGGRSRASTTTATPPPSSSCPATGPTTRCRT